MKLIKQWLILICFIGLAVACSSNSDNGSTTPPPATSKAVAGPDQTVTSGDPVTLNGASSTPADSNTSITTYQWMQTAGSPLVTLVGSDQVSASFTAPNVTVVTTLVFQLTISDSQGKQYSDSVTVTVNPVPNQAPVAVASASSTTVVAGSSVTLDGTGSHDPDANDSITSYSWSLITSITGVNLSGADQVQATFIAPSVTSNTLITFQLTVADSRGATNSNNISITVTPSGGGSGPYVPILTYNQSGTTLAISVIDNANPNAGPIPIESGGIPEGLYQRFTQYDFNPSSFEISNGHAAYLLYFKNNKFWRVALEAGSDLQPQQVSSDSYVICGDGHFHNPNIPLNVLEAPIIFEAVAVGQNCGLSNPLKLIQLGYNATDTALDATGKLSGARSIEADDNGFYTLNGNNLYYYSKDLNTATNLNIAVTDPTTFEFLAFENSHLITRYDNNIVSIDTTQMSVNGTVSASSPIWQASAKPDNFTCDHSACFFNEAQGGGSYLFYGFPLDGSSQAAVLSGSNVTFHPEFLQLSMKNLYFKNIDVSTGNFEFYRFPRTPVSGDAPILMESGKTLFPISLVGPRGVFYDFYKLDSGGNIVSSSAVFYDETANNKSESVNSMIVGLQFDKQIYNTYEFFGRAFIATNVLDPTAGLGGATIKAYSVNDGSALPDFGTLPSNSQITNLFISGVPYYGSNRYYAMATYPSTASSIGIQSDVIMFDTAGTLTTTNLTNTDSSNEEPDILF